MGLRRKYANSGRKSIFERLIKFPLFRISERGGWGHGNIFILKPEREYHIIWYSEVWYADSPLDQFLWKNASYWEILHWLKNLISENVIINFWKILLTSHFAFSGSSTYILRCENNFNKFEENVFCQNKTAKNQVYVYTVLDNTFIIFWFKVCA